MSTNAAQNRPARKRLGEILIEAGLVSAQDIELALREGQQKGQPLGQVLVRMGKINNEQLGKALSIQFQVKYVCLSKIDIPKSLFELLPEEFMRDKHVLPIGKERGRLVVAMVDPTNRGH